MKKVYVAKNPADAHLVKGLLEGESISAVVQGEFLWGVRGEVPLIPETSPSVWVVEDADHDRAKELIRAFDLGTRKMESESQDWRCTHCGEDNEGAFTECWHCGQSRRIS